MGQDYLNAGHAMDRGYYDFYKTLDRWGGSVMHPVAIHERDGGAKSNLGPRELGTTINPMQNQIIALQAKIREGASRLEIGFAGTGKGSAQQATPEAYGELDRETLRQIAEYNDVKTTTHAAFGVIGLAGFNQNSFNKQAQHMAMEEVRKAVDFASQATTGGAIVVHTGEWSRAVSEAPWAKKDFAKDFGDKAAYRGYIDEDKKAILPVVDKRTGEIVAGIRKDQEIVEPEWLTIDNYERATGRKLQSVDINGRTVNPASLNRFTTYVTEDGRVISRDDPNAIDARVPVLDPSGKTKTKILGWKDIEEQTREYNRVNNVKKTPEEVFALLQIDKAILEQRSSRLYYDDPNLLREQANAYIDQLQEIERKSKGGPLSPEELRRAQQLRMELNRTAEQLPRANQVQAARDTQERELLRRAENLETIEQYGLKQSGQAIGDLGIYAMEKSKKMFDDAAKRGVAHKYDKLYIAPENVFVEQYGSHPDELMNIIQAGRDHMAENLVKQYGKSKEEAQQLAKDHIKSTIDIGHLNMWKSHMERKPGETDEAFGKRFETWVLGKVDEMHKKGMIGHIHLTDNLGFNDEHLTPGQGNAPIKAFVKKLEDLGYKDFIAEIGSFNANTILQETWTHLGSRHFAKGYMGGGQWGDRFKDIHVRHFGGYAAPVHMVGGYVPSNDFTLWSQVPFE